MPFDATPSPVLSPAQKAWETRRARLAASTAVAAPVAPAKRQKAQPVSRFDATGPAELTAGQKAAETKRARDAMRQRQQALKAGIADASPVEDSPVVRLYLDEAKIGCGYREFVVLEIGPRWVRLAYTPTLQEIRVDRLEFDAHATPRPAHKRRRAETIRATIAQTVRLFPDECSGRVRVGNAALRALGFKAAA